MSEYSKKLHRSKSETAIETSALWQQQQQQQQKRNSSIKLSRIRARNGATHGEGGGAVTGSEYHGPQCGEQKVIIFEMEKKQLGRGEGVREGATQKCVIQFHIKPNKPRVK